MPSSRRPAYRWQPDSGFIYAGLSSLRPRIRPWLAPSVVRAKNVDKPFLPTVITETGFDIGRYISSGLFGPVSSRLA
jgi:hypothetical protein